MARRRITRKEIKHDEFVEGVDRVAQWIERNARTVVLAVVGLLVAVVIVLGARWFAASARAEASQALARGQAAYAARLVSPEAARPDDPYAPTFASDEERLARALEEFRTAGEAFLSPSRDVARLYEGLVLADQGKSDEARLILDELSRQVGDDPTLGPLTRGLSARLALAEGDWERAEGLYRDLLEAGDGYPRGLAELGLARALAGSGRHEEARRHLANIERAEAGTGLEEVARVHRQALP